LYFPSTPINYASGTYVANAGISPDGTQNAPSFTPSGYSVLYSNTITTTAQSYTWSLYLKGTVNGQKVKLGSDVATITELTLTTDWARYSVTFTASATTYGYYIVAGSYFSPAENNLFYAWGSQIEASSYATSLILTTSASATRVVDACFRNLYAAEITTEATLFSDFEYQRNDGGYATSCLVYNQTLGHYIYLYVVSNSIRALCANGGVLQSNIISSTVTPNTRYKVAARYKTNDFSLYVNGVLVGIDTSGTMPTFSASSTNTYIGTDSSLTEPVGKLNEFVAFPMALSDAECISLTTI
jgi:hypothetical protein